MSVALCTARGYGTCYSVYFLDVNPISDLYAPRIYYPSGTFPGGRISLAFVELDVGDGIEFKGPVGHFVWKGRWMASVHERIVRIREIGLICGGSGITPILQILREILSDPSATPGPGNEDTFTKAWLLDANTDLDDILCKEELDALAANNEKTLKVHYTLTGKSVPEGWRYSTGRVTTDMLEAHLPSPGDDKMVCICAPHGMEESVKKTLVELGWDNSTQIVLF